MIKLEIFLKLKTLEFALVFKSQLTAMLISDSQTSLSCTNPEGGTGGHKNIVFF